MNILLVGHDSGDGGAERALLSLTRILLSLGHRASALLPDAQGASPRHFVAMGVPCFTMPMQHAAPATSFALAQISLINMEDVVRSLAAENFDLVLTNTSVLLHGCFIAEALRLPHIVYNHELLDGDSVLKPRGLPLPGYLELLCSLTDHMLCCSEAVMRQVRCQVSEMPASVLYPFMLEGTLPAHHPVDSSSDEVVQLMVIGVQSVRKNQAFAVAVQSTLVKRGVSCNLHFFGTEGLQTQRIRTLIARRGNPESIRFHGQVEDPYVHVSGRVINLICADSEPFGLTIPESLMRGIPVVSTRSGGPEGLLPESCLYDLGDLADCIRKLEMITRDYDQASRNARACFEEHSATLSLGHQAAVLQAALDDAVSRYCSKSLPQPYVGKEMRCALLLEAMSEAEIVANIAQVANLTTQDIQQLVASEKATPGFAVNRDCSRYDVIPHAYSPQLDMLYRDGIGMAIELAATYTETGRLCMAAFILTRLMYERKLRGGPLRVLAIGDGIGIDSMRLAAMGFDVDYIDYDTSVTARIAQANFERFRSKELPLAGQIRVLPGNPSVESYDFVMCLEVVEHVLNPLQFLRTIASYANSGALLFISECFDGVDPKWPTHLLENEPLTGLLPLLVSEVGLYLDDYNVVPVVKPYLFRKAVNQPANLLQGMIKEGLFHHIIEAQAQVGY